MVFKRLLGFENVEPIENGMRAARFLECPLLFIVMTSAYGRMELTTCPLFMGLRILSLRLPPCRA